MGVQMLAQDTAQTRVNFTIQCKFKDDYSLVYS